MQKHIKTTLTLLFVLAQVMVFATGEGDDQRIKRIRALEDEAFKYSQILNDEETADSLSFQAITLAQGSLDKDILYDALMHYFKRDVHGSSAPKDQHYIQMAMDLEYKIKDPKKRMEMWLTLAHVLVQANDPTKAMIYSGEAMAYAASDSDKNKIRAYLSTAESALAKKQIAIAWRDILNAEEILSEHEGQHQDIKYLYQNLLVDFHTQIGAFQKAIEIKKDQLKWLEQTHQTDSIEYMWQYYQLRELAVMLNPKLYIEEQIDVLLAYCQRNQNETLKVFVLALSRSHLIENQNGALFEQRFGPFYRSQDINHPDLLKRIEICQSNAFLCENQNDFKGARNFHQKAIRAAKAYQNEYKLANAHKRNGLFLTRHGLLVEARVHLDTALQISIKKQNTRDIIELSQILEKAAIAVNDTSAAYNYAKVKEKALKKAQVVQNNEQLVLMKTQSDKIRQEKQELVQLDEKKKKEKLQFTGIGVGLVILFLLLVVVSSMAVPNWVIQMLAFFSILFIFEFAILMMDQMIPKWAHDEPIEIFLVKIAILSFMFPLHHVIERGVTAYMVKHQLVKRPKRSALKKFLYQLYPWLTTAEGSEDNEIKKRA